ncbi:hypothetical protein B9T29_15320 [Acinetobacter sp. ANC 3903]|uniref:hypothetical protein n=1 Tax=Acinetobacter sp. ANC 3903 TaxID=1977883 RepID=UPI000B559746|nr:hypothetical protein [Acinetobacter sp. ANC 3903]OTG57045.1 hypothetical protein B9T29_15320 [Acinetobacter sp. ANC 3903]
MDLTGIESAQSKKEKSELFKNQKEKTINDLSKLEIENWETILKTPDTNLKIYIESMKKRVHDLTSADEIHLLKGIENRLKYIFTALEKVKNPKENLDENTKRTISEYPDKIQADIYSCFVFLEEFESIKSGFNSIIQDPLKNTIKDVEQELNEFRRLRNISDNARTEDIYNEAVAKYRALEVQYRDYFYYSIVTVFGVATYLFLFKSAIQFMWGLENIEFWIFKFSILAVGITLITYFLKQSTHYQRLADQNYQTQVELQAYPSFMESIPTAEAASVRKELALKYFGREIDGAAHKDMSNLISDQMKSTTEMVKAATDVLKVKEKP